MLNYSELDAIRNAGHGVWRWDSRTNVVFFSNEWKEMLGYAEDEIINSIDEWSSRVHSDDLDRCSHALINMFNGNSPEYRCVHRMKCKNGEYIWILDIGKPIEWDFNGRPTCVLGTHTNITDIIEHAKDYIEFAKS